MSETLSLLYIGGGKFVPLEIGNETYYTATEAAQYLQISRDTFYENVRNKLQPYKPGARKRIYYRRSELDKYLEVEPLPPDDSKG